MMSNPVDTYFALVAALKSEDEAAIRALISPDFVMYEDEGMPYGGVYRGQDGFFELIDKVWRTWGGTHFEPLYQIADPAGSMVCAVVGFRGTPGQSTEAVEALINEVWEFRNGQAVEARVWYFDAPRLCRAIEGTRA